MSRHTRPRATTAQHFDEDVRQNEHNTCPECGGRVTSNTHETVCDDCGLVISEQAIDRGPEWRSFDDDSETPKRTGAPLTPARHDRGLTTDIGRNHDANGNRIDGQKRRQLARLRREHERSKRKTKRERNQMHGLTEIRRITSALGLPESIRNQACQLFRTAQSEDLLRGRSIESIATASVYAACRCNDCPRLMSDLAGVAKVGEGRIERAYTVLNRDLGLPVAPALPADYIPQLASEFDLSAEIERQATDLAQRARAEGLTNGRHPAGVAAACLYLLTQRRGAWVRQADLADAADVTPVTVRARRKELQSLMD